MILAQTNTALSVAGIVKSRFNNLKFYGFSKENVETKPPQLKIKPNSNDLLCLPSHLNLTSFFPNKRSKNDYSLCHKSSHFLYRKNTSKSFYNFLYKPRLNDKSLFKREFSSSLPKLNKNILSRLENDALLNRDDLFAQNEFYKKLFAFGHYDIIKSRFESKEFSSDKETYEIYLKSLIKSGSSPDKIAQLASQFTHGDKKNKHNTEEEKIKNIVKSIFTNKEKPLRVQIEESRGFALWKILKSIGLAFLYTYIVFSVFKISIESSGGNGSLKELMPNGSQASYLVEEDIKTTFADVEGLEEVKEELQDIVKFLKNPEQYNSMGAKLPKGVLLTGPPGTGKTLLARAIAGESKVPFLLMSGAEFDEVYVGVGAKRVRDLFAQAKKKSPCIIFIDELDAVGSKRNPKDPSLLKQTLNQLLVELDGFSPNEGIILIGATNFPALLDDALLRPGRFDLNIEVPLPDVRGRLSILRLYAKKVILHPSIDLHSIAKGTPGFSGAELANLINIAAFQATKNNKRQIDDRDLEFALDRIRMGTERKSLLITEKEKLMTAYHEAGHAIVAYFTPGATPLHKVTVIPRGQALGMTVQLPEGDEHSVSRMQYKAMLDVCMGGRVAEEIIYGTDLVSSGAHNDIQKATQIAHSMVTKIALSDATINGSLGLVDYHQLKDNLAPSTLIAIDNEVKHLIDDAYKRAHSLLKSKRHLLNRLADKLMLEETLNRADIDKLFMS